MTCTTCPSLLSVAVVNTMKKKKKQQQLGEERVLLAYGPLSQDLKAGTQDRSLETGAKGIKEECCLQAHFL